MAKWQSQGHSSSIRSMRPMQNQRHVGGGRLPLPHAGQASESLSMIVPLVSSLVRVLGHHIPGEDGQSESGG